MPSPVVVRLKNAVCPLHKTGVKLLTRTVGVTTGSTLIVIVFEVAGLLIAQTASESIVTCIISPLLSVELAKLLVAKGCTTPFTVQV